jgi:hypothetical protein
MAGWSNALRKFRGSDELAIRRITGIRGNPAREIRLEFRRGAQRNSAGEKGAKKRGSATSDDAADRESEYEQRYETVDEEGLPLVPRPEVRPRKWQDKHRRQSVQVVRSRGRSRARGKHGYSSGHLRQNEYLAYRQRSRVASR